MVKLFQIVFIAACVGCSHSGIDRTLAARGEAAMLATEKYFAISNGLYREDWKAPTTQPSAPASIWPAGVQLAALNAAAMLDRQYISKASAYALALDPYRTKIDDHFAYRPMPSGKRAEPYYDDNEWIVLDLIETYELTHDHKFLDRAQETFDFVASGESPDWGGGIWWRTRRDSKNTCSNAPAICSALRLYQHTHDRNLIATAQRIYRWTKARLQDDDGLYFDATYPNGKIGTMKWSYNTAMMLRATCLLFQATEEEHYLIEAKRVAAAAEKHWFRDADGALMDEAAFAHFLCEALLFLSDIDHDPHHVAVVHKALEYLYQNCRSPDDLYPKRWDEPLKQTEFRLIEHASAARAFFIAAQYPTPSR